MVDQSAGEHPTREFAVEIVQRLQEAGYRALWAGGCVRDLLLGKAPKDFDVATDARPEDVQRLFRRTRAVGAAFGVILVHGPKGTGNVEVATFRSEGPYLDGRRPEHVVFSSPEEDAQRRDFTINGMFIDPLTQQVFDFVGGQEDIRRKLVRAIGDPHARFREDKLRLLRAIRFAANLEFQLDPTTATAVRDMSSEIHIVSPERITQELRRMLVDQHRVRALELARESRLLVEIFPELKPLVEPADREADFTQWNALLRTLRALPQPSFELALATLLHDVPGLGPAQVAEITRRMRLANKESEQIAWLVAHRNALRDPAGLPISQLKRILAEPFSRDLLALNRAAAQARQLDLSAVEFCERFLRDTPPAELNPPPLLTGDDLIRLGLRPGPTFKTILEQVRDAQLENRIQTHAAALELASQLQKDAPQAKEGS
jgi:poly(A) polymerase